MDDKEMKVMAQEEIPALEASIQKKQEEITQIEIKHDLSDPDDRKSVIIEIRAGAGGDEASLFASDLYRMYANFASTNNWNVEMIDANSNETGGYKEVTAHIKGSNVYEKLKYESGVHRVQRIPVTESSGRIHTSTVSVAILPEVKDIELNIKKEDLKVETMRASGAGGQCVNKTSSAIRITHLPSGIVVSCQDTKVQQQNKDKAMQILRARLYEKEKQEEMAKRSSMRSAQIGTAMRAEKIRTYNYPQSRITDHRVKISWHNLEGMLNGDLTQALEQLHESMMQMQLDEIKKNKEKQAAKVTETEVK